MGTRLYVGNLSYNVTERELRDVFAEGGRNVVEVKVVMDRDTGRPRGFAFVEMGSDDEATAAISVVERARDSGPPDQRQRSARARAALRRRRWLRWRRRRWLRRRRRRRWLRRWRRRRAVAVAVAATARAAAAAAAVATTAKAAADLAAAAGSPEPLKAGASDCRGQCGRGPAPPTVSASARRPSGSARMTLRPSVWIRPLRLNCERVSDTVSRVEPMRFAISWCVILRPTTVPRSCSMPCSWPRFSSSSASLAPTSLKMSCSTRVSRSLRRVISARRELVGGAAVGLQQAVEQLARDLDGGRCVHRLGHLLARPALEQAGLAEEVAFGAVGQGQLLAVARDLRDLDAPGRQEVDPLRAIARQVDDLARPVVAGRQAGQQRLQSFGRDVGQGRRTCAGAPTPVSLHRSALRRSF